MVKPHLKIAKKGVVLTVACFALVLDVSAGEWRVKSGLNVGHVYTDNVELDESDKDSELISVVRPTFSLLGEGNRANVSFISAFEFNDSGGSADSFSPRISANADAELIEDFLFVDADLTSNQSTIDPFSSAGDSQLNQSDNVTTTYDYSISPYIVRHFGKTADLTVRYTYDDQINKGDELADSVYQSASAKLESGEDFARFNWTLNTDYEETDYEDDETTTPNGQDGNRERLSSSIALGYQLNRKIQIKGMVGKEWNNYQTFDDDDTDDQFWDVGLIWTPNRRTTLDLGYGKHFYSTTPRFEFSHTTRKTTFKASYIRSLTDTRSERGSSEPFFFSNEQRELLEQLGVSDIAIDITESLLQTQNLNENPTFGDQGVFVNELFESSLSVKGKRTTTTIYLRESKQIREDVDEDAIFTSMGMRLERKLSSKYTLNSRVTWDERKDQRGFTSDRTLWHLSLRRQLGARTSVSIAYSFGERDSDRANDDYEENRVSLNFSIDL